MIACMSRLPQKLKSFGVSGQFHLKKFQKKLSFLAFKTFQNWTFFVDCRAKTLAYPNALKEKLGQFFPELGFEDEKVKFEERKLHIL